MYRQILVHPDDRNLQRVLWRKNDKQQVQEYQLDTVTYGLACAPYLAIRTLHQLANDEGRLYPRGAAVLRSHCYVDDILTGADTIEEAREVQEDLNFLCAAGGFPLRKWASNTETLLEGIPAEYQQQQSPPACVPHHSAEDEMPELEARAHLAAKGDDHILLQLYSSLRKLLRVTVWCRRWLCKYKRANYLAEGLALAPQELEAARLTWLRLNQTAHFKVEQSLLSREKPLPRNSPLTKLTRFYDDTGLLRVGGRLKQSLLSPDERHPVILPAAARFTTMVIDACHRETMHGGIQLTLGILRVDTGSQADELQSGALSIDV